MYDRFPAHHSAPAPAPPQALGLIVCTLDGMPWRVALPINAVVAWPLPFLII